MGLSNTLGALRETVTSAFTRKPSAKEILDIVGDDGPPKPDLLSDVFDHADAREGVYDSHLRNQTGPGHLMLKARVSDAEAALGKRYGEADLPTKQMVWDSVHEIRGDYEADANALKLEDARENFSMGRSLLKTVGKTLLWTAVGAAAAPLIGMAAPAIATAAPFLAPVMAPLAAAGGSFLAGAGAAAAGTIGFLDSFSQTMNDATEAKFRQAAIPRYDALQDFMPDIAKLPRPEQEANIAA